MANIPLVSKAWRIYSEQGLAALMTALRRRVYDRHLSAWFRLPLAESTGIIPGRFEGSLDFDHPDRVLAWIETLALPGLNDRVEIDSMKARGHLFVGALNGDRLIGYIKIGWERVWVVDYSMELEIPAGDYFIIDLFIDPASRGLGAGPFLVSAAAEEMKKRGFSGSIMHIRLDKQPMLRSAARTGYHDIGRVDYMSICGKKIFRPHPAKLIAAATGHGI